MERKEGNPLLYLFGRLWHYSSTNHVLVVVFYCMLIIATSIDLFAQPFIWAKIIENVTRKGEADDILHSLTLLLSLSVLVEFFSWAFHGPARVLECLNAFYVRMTYRKHLIKGVMSLPMSWHVEHHSGDTIDKVNRGASALFSFSESSFQIVYSVVRLIGSYGVLVYFSPSSSYIVIAMMALTAYIVMQFDKVLVREYRELNKSENRISEKIFDTLSNISTVITLRVERFVFRAFVHKLEEPYLLYKRNTIRNEIKWFLTSMCCVIMSTFVLGVYFFTHVGKSDGLIVSEVYLLISYLERISSLFHNFASMYGEVLKRRANVHNAEELQVSFQDDEKTEHVLPGSWQKLHIKDLLFSYDNGDDVLHLDQVSVTLHRGEKVAFIGETGSGKTTFLKVVRGLYPAKSVTLLADQVVIESGFDGIREDIALVPQNPEIFATTIRENITVGAEYDEELIAHYVKMARFQDVVNGLPKGMESSTKEKGVNLSGGQQQRLALARGLLASHDKNIVLLDEPTSSLDAATEMLVYHNIFKGCLGKTIISTIHRMHLLPLFDRIFLFENGKVIACGSLNELLSSSQEFRHLWEKGSTSAVE
jgi:ABC-type multidrug transport system fused ATPase/permease subunit